MEIKHQWLDLDSKQISSQKSYLNSLNQNGNKLKNYPKTLDSPQDSFTVEKIKSTSNIDINNTNEKTIKKIYNCDQLLKPKEW